MAGADAGHAGSADDVAPDNEPFPLEIGPWRALGYANGTATASAEGIDIVWTGEIPAEFTFDVFDGGIAEGTWTHTGSAVMEISGNVQGQRLTATGDLTFAGGGAVSGTNEVLQLRGSTATTGSVNVEVAGVGSRSMSISNSNPVPPLTVEVAASTCDEAYGQWVYTVEQEFAEQGFSPSFDGYWLGFRQTDDIENNIGDLLDSINDPSAEGESQSPLMVAAAQLLGEYNAFVDAQPWTLPAVLGLGERTEQILNILRNLTDCEKRLYGEDNVETFVNGLTFIIQNLAIGSASGGLDLSSSDLQHLVHLATRNAALGPGAPNPAAAVAAEDALRSIGAAILEQNVDPADGRIFVNDDTRRVMAIGAAMGWTYTVAGTTYDARETYEHNIDDTSWQDSVPEAES